VARFLGSAIVAEGAAAAFAEVQAGRFLPGDRLHFGASLKVVSSMNRHHGGEWSPTFQAVWVSEWPLASVRVRVPLSKR
jgi:hypothetical protein